MRIRSFFALAFIVGSATLFGGCVDNRSTLFVNGVVAPDSGADCSYAIPATDFIGFGTFDPNVKSSYTARIEVGNQLVPQGNNSTLRAETSRIQLQGAVVEITSSSGGTVVAPFTSAFSGTVSPDASTNPGYAQAGITLIPPSADLGDGTYIAIIKVFGTTLGGKDIESGEFNFPITVQRLALTRCNVPADLAEEDACGLAGQDGNRLLCLDGDGRQGCAVCP